MISREDFISTIPNVSYVNDNEAKEQNIEDLLSLSDEKYLFACGDISTKTFEDDTEVAWFCHNSQYEITVDKDKSDYYYGVANYVIEDENLYE